MMDQLLNNDLTEFFYTERVVFRKDLNTNNNWTFDLGNSGESTPTFVRVGIQARNKIDSQTLDNAIFDRLPISYAVCKKDRKIILLTELNANMIETTTVKHIKK